MPKAVKHEHAGADERAATWQDIPQQLLRRRMALVNEIAGPQQHDLPHASASSLAHKQRIKVRGARYLVVAPDAMQSAARNQEEVAGGRQERLVMQSLVLVIISPGLACQCAAARRGDFG